MLQSQMILPNGMVWNQITLKEMNIAGYLHELPACMTKFVPKCTKACVSDPIMDNPGFLSWNAIGTLGVYGSGVCGGSNKSAQINIILYALNLHTL